MPLKTKTQTNQTGRKRMTTGFETWFKKPVAIRAKQMPEPFEVKTLEGTMKGKTGDYLIIGIKNEQYPCDKKIFEATYTKQKAISIEEHEALKNTCDFWIGKVRLFESYFKKNAFKTISGDEFISLDWLEPQLQLLLARSVWEMLPVYAWESASAKSVYNEGVKEAEKQWHELITELLLTSKKEVDKE